MIKGCIIMATISASVTAHAGDAEPGGKYAFDGKIAREVLENYQTNETSEAMKRMS